MGNVVWIQTAGITFVDRFKFKFEYKYSRWPYTLAVLLHSRPYCSTTSTYISTLYFHQSWSEVSQVCQTITRWLIMYGWCVSMYNVLFLTMLYGEAISMSVKLNATSRWEWVWKVVARCCRLLSQPLFMNIIRYYYSLLYKDPVYVTWRCMSTSNKRLTNKTITILVKIDRQGSRRITVFVNYSLAHRTNNNSNFIDFYSCKT